MATPVSTCSNFEHSPFYLAHVGIKRIAVLSVAPALNEALVWPRRVRGEPSPIICSQHRPQRGLNWILSTVQCDDLHGEVSSQLYLSPLIPLNTSAGTNKATLTLELGLSTLWCKPQLGVMSRTQQAGNGYGQSRKYVFFCRRQFTINHLAHFLETQGIMKNNKKRFEL